MKYSVKWTRFKGLGFTYFGYKHWQFVDLSWKPADEMPTQIGAIYPSRSELQADINRFAEERGFVDLR